MKNLTLELLENTPGIVNMTQEEQDEDDHTPHDAPQKVLLELGSNLEQLIGPQLNTKLPHESQPRTQNIFALVSLTNIAKVCSLTIMLARLFPGRPATTGSPPYSFPATTHTCLLGLY